MTQSVPHSVTIEKAVALMVNMDHIPEGCTLLEMLDAFVEVAETDHENDPTDSAIKIRMESCISRYNLADLLLASLKYEVEDPENSMIVLSDDSTSTQRLTLESLYDWAADKYGIVISPKDFDKNSENVRWEDITIKIFEGHKIGYKIKNGKFIKKHLKDVGLMGQNKHEPNEKFENLMRFSVGKNFPTGNLAEGKHRKAICDLGYALRKLIALQGSPFKEFNKDEGYKPKFKITSYLKDTDDYTYRYLP